MSGFRARLTCSHFRIRAEPPYASATGTVRIGVRVEPEDAGPHRLSLQRATDSILGERLRISGGMLRGAFLAPLDRHGRPAPWARVDALLAAGELGLAARFDREDVVYRFPPDVVRLATGRSAYRGGRMATWQAGTHDAGPVTSSCDVPVGVRFSSPGGPVGNGRTLRIGCEVPYEAGAWGVTRRAALTPVAMAFDLCFGIFAAALTFGP